MQLRDQKMPSSFAVKTPHNAKHLGWEERLFWAEYYKIRALGTSDPCDAIVDVSGWINTETMRNCHA